MIKLERFSLTVKKAFRRADHNVEKLFPIPSIQKLEKYRNLVVIKSRESSDRDDFGNPRLPNTSERIIAGLVYIIPALGSIALTLCLFKWLASLSWAWFIMEPVSMFYYSGQFTPFLIFMLVFLAIVRNKKFHHLVRFHGMQAVMVDIAITLAIIVRSHLPPEIRWSSLMLILDRFIGATIVMTLLHCIWHAVQGRYADIPYVSDAVYIQVDILDMSDS